MNKPSKTKKPWHWPFLRVNFGGDKEYACEHGIGHGGLHGCDRCPCDIKTMVRAWRETTPCEKCGNTPIEYHNFNHCKKPWLRVSSLVNRGSVVRVLQEIENCEKLCRSCHMKADGRLNRLQENKPFQKGFALPARKCVGCGKLAKPLRKHLCYTCYEKHRVGGRSFIGHSYSKDCCHKTKKGPKNG